MLLLSHHRNYLLVCPTTYYRDDDSGCAVQVRRSNFSSPLSKFKAPSWQGLDQKVRNRVAVVVVVAVVVAEVTTIMIIQ